MPRREKISAVDTAWLRMDRPGNPMMICGVWLMRSRIPLSRLRRTIDERFLCFGRFRQRPVQQNGAAFWQDDAAFDIRRHVLEATLPEPAGQPELQHLVSALAGTPLDPDRPLWQFLLVRNYRHGTALVVRMHHCYADGIALTQVVLSMTDAGPHGPAALPPPPRRASRAHSSDDLNWLTQPIDGALRLATKIGSTLLEKGVELWANPLKAVDLAQQGGAFAREIANLALMGEDSPTRFKAVPLGKKHVAWADPLDLDEVKAIGKALGASVNDVLISCAVAALGEYLRSRNDPVHGVMMRALVPVNLRPPAHTYQLGNQFGLVFLDLPLGLRNPVERLYAVRANMRALKGSYQPVLTLGLLAAVGAGPKMLQDQLLETLAKNATAVMTNVPGPQQKLYLAGSAIDAMMFWVPQSGNIGMGASIISYDGRVQFGLITDHEICAEPERIVPGFTRAFEALVLTTLMAPWPWEGDLDPALAAAAAGMR